MKQKTNKRQLLIDAGKILFSQKGFNATTLANISALANIPLGNIYYYFKSKYSIAAAGLVQSKKLQKQHFEELNELPSAKERLTSMINSASGDVENIVKFGDPIGSMCQELRKMGGNLGKDAAGIMEERLSWCEKQFEEIGNGKSSRLQAINLISCLQGSNLLTLALKKKIFLTEAKNYICENL